MSTQPVGYSNYSNIYEQLSSSSAKMTARQSANNLAEQTSLKSQVREQISRYLDDIPKGDDGTLSFKDVENYRADLEKKWDESVKADLKKLGINTDKEFPLSYDPATGKLTVNEGHPDKDKIDKYFESNQDKVNEFNDIVQIGKLTSVSRSKLSPMETKQSLQQQAISWWYSDNTDPTSWFSGGGLMLGQGQSQASYAGLNLRV